MNPTITEKDVRKALGMFLAHEFYKTQRNKSGATPISLIVTFMKIAEVPMMEDLENYLAHESIEHAETLQRAVDDVNSNMGIEQPPQHMKEFYAKQTAVMGALAEVELAKASQNMEELIARLEAIDMDQPDAEDMMRKITAGIDPHLVEIVSRMVVEDSYPTLKPTIEVLASLWLEGFFIAVTCDLFYDSTKDHPQTRMLEKSLRSKFIVVP